MSAFHFKCDLVEEITGEAKYRFQSNYVDAPSRGGHFVVNAETWKWTIQEPAPDELSQHCVSALVHKIRKDFSTNGFPGTVYFVA